MAVRTDITTIGTSDDSDSDDGVPKKKMSLLDRFRSLFGFGGKKKRKRRHRAGKVAADADEGIAGVIPPSSSSASASASANSSSSVAPAQKGAATATVVDAEEAEFLREFAAAACIQAMIRRFLAPFKRQRQWKAACQAADKYFIRKVEDKKKEVSNRKSGQEMFKVFVRTYVSDLVQTGRVFILQDACAVKIQRLYRGFLVRRIYNFAKRFRRKKRPPMVNKRVTPEMARRVWARTEFVPANGGWPSGIDKQAILQYDMSEHADKPPGGRDFGLKTFKVVVSARNAREERVLLHDPAAWVGIPVLVEPRKLWLKRERERKAQLMLLSGTTPYLEHRTVDIPPKPRLEGVALLKELGWRKDMIDRELAVLPRREQRSAFNMVNPLATHQVADIMDGMFRSEALHKRMSNIAQKSPTNKRLASRKFSALGNLSQESQISLPTQASISVASRAGSTIRDGRSPSQNQSQSQSQSISMSRSRSGVRSQSTMQQQATINSNGQSQIQSQGAGFIAPEPQTQMQMQQSHVRKGWTSANINTHSYVLPPSDPEESKRLLDSGVGTSLLSAPPSSGTKATRLVTPLRGAIKPLPREYSEALSQHDLLPSQVQRAATRAKQQGFEDFRWKSSAWADIKRQAESFARGEQGLEAARRQDAESTYTLSDKLEKQLSCDPWTRQLYRPKASVPCRIDAFPLRRKKHFKTRYSWLPQPLVSQAALRVIDDSRDVVRRSYDPPLSKPGRVNHDSAEENGAEELDNDDEEGVGTLESSFLTQSQFDGSSLASMTASRASLGPDKHNKPKTAKKGGPAKHPNVFL